MPADSRTPASRVRPGWLPLVVLALFVAGVWLRIDVFSLPHNEGDEVVYRSLVEQLEAGKGYTLRGHPLFLKGGALQEQYDQPMFYHPPGGIALFWALHRVSGAYGLGLAQLVSFAIFYWSLLGGVRLVLREAGPIPMTALAAAAAFTPIMAHVGTHHWLDAPQVAFATAGTTFFLLAVRRKSTGFAIAAAGMLTWACLTKLNAVLVIPGVVALAWSLVPGRSLKPLIAPTTICAGLVGLGVGIWLWLQWTTFGELFPAWAGKPAPDLLARSKFVEFVTVVRGPWSYLRLLPQAMPSVLVAVLAAPWLLGDRERRGAALALAGWIALILGVHIVLGAIGYSKLLRYVILVVPAGLWLFALATEAAVTRLAAGGAARKLAMAWLAAAVLAVGIEVSLGVTYLQRYPQRALLVLYPDGAMWGDHFRFRTR